MKNLFYAVITFIGIISFNACEPPVTLNQNASLATIKINSIELEGFHADTLVYNFELPFGTTEIPTIEATTAFEKASVNIINTTTLPGSTTISVTAEDVSVNLTYVVNFTTDSGNEDATLLALLVDDVALEDFSNEVSEYEITLPYGTTEIPVISANLTDPNATFTIVQANELPGTATINVVAQNISFTKTFTIQFKIEEPTNTQLICRTEWLINKAIMNEEDMTSEIGTVKFLFKEDGSLIITSEEVEQDTWKFNEEEDQVIVESDGMTIILSIIELTENSLIIKYTIPEEEDINMHIEFIPVNTDNQTKNTSVNSTYKLLTK